MKHYVICSKIMRVCASVSNISFETNEGDGKGTNDR